MRLLRALLNSGVFMILMLAGATLYLVYSDAIKQDHGIASAQVSSKASETTKVEAVQSAQGAEISQSSVTEPKATEAVASAVTEQEKTVAAEHHSTPVANEAPIQAEPALDTQYPAQQPMSFPPMAEPMQMPPMMQAPTAMYQPPMEMPPMPTIPNVPEPMPMQVIPEPMPMVQFPSEQMIPPTQQGMPEPVQQHPMPVAPEDMSHQVASVSLVDQARAALYAGDLVAAEQAYIAALAQRNDPDLHGELGNVYFSQQNWPAASRAYAAAIEGLSAKGRYLQAQYVLGFLMQIDPEMGQQSMAVLRSHMYPPSAGR